MAIDTASPHILVTGNTLRFKDNTFPCAIGKGGFAADKREGDGATPIGVFPLRQCYYRADRLIAPRTALTLLPIAENNGWCDDPQSPHYNRPVTLPFTASHEKLWREEHVYDLIVPLGYNDDPIMPGKGSAIFMHLAKPGYPGTEGCVALAQEDLLWLLAEVTPQTLISLHP